jgi:DNA-binding FrmR family transcriptional regulator
MFTLTTPKQHVLHRLKICAGHLQAIQTKIENYQDCLAVVHQIQAVESALKKVEQILIQDYLLKHSKSPKQLIAAVKLISSSSLHLPPSTIHQ